MFYKCCLPRLIQEAALLYISSLFTTFLSVVLHTQKTAQTADIVARAVFLFRQTRAEQRKNKEPVLI